MSILREKSKKKENFRFFLKKVLTLILWFDILLVRVPREGLKKGLKKAQKWSLKTKYNVNELIE